MNPPFWQVNAGQIIVGLGTLLGGIGGAWIFSWKMGLMHGQNIEKIDGLGKDMKAQIALAEHHEEEIKSLRELARSSSERLRLLEEEMRDNRKRGDRHLY